MAPITRRLTTNAGCGIPDRLSRLTSETTFTTSKPPTSAAVTENHVASQRLFACPFASTTPLLGLRVTQRENSHRRRHSEAHRQDTCSNPCCHKKVPAALDDVACGEALAESRRDDQRACERQAHLAAMSMASQRQCDSARHDRENIGIVRQQENWSALVLDRRQCGGQIMPSGPQVTDPRDPKMPAGVLRRTAVSSTTRMPLVSTACLTRSWSNQPS